MAGLFPRFRLYEDDGSTLVYEFEQVVDWGDSPFQDPETFVEHISLRGQGSIISEGSQEPWDFSMQFRLEDEDYENLVAQINTLSSSTIVKNTKYILKIDLTSSGSTKDLKVKLLQDIRFPITNQGNKVVTSQRGFITLRVNSWA